MSALNASNAVADLVARRDAHRAQQARLEIIPGMRPLPGVATAYECQKWDALRQQIAWCDMQIAQIREAVAA